MNELTERIAQLYQQQIEIEQKINKSITAVYQDLSPIAVLEKLIEKHEVTEIPAQGINVLMDKLIDRFLPLGNMFNPLIKQFISTKVVAKIFDKTPEAPIEKPIVKPPAKQYIYDHNY